MATAGDVRPLRGEHESTLPLTAAQEALWFAQQALGDTPLTISQYTDISGDLDVNALRLAVNTVGRDMGTTVTTITERAGRPHLSINDKDPAPSLEVIDFRHHTEPRRAARQQMDLWSRAPMPLSSNHLVSSALLRVGNRRWYLFSRAHHIVLDGFGAYVLLSRIARTYQLLINPGQTAAERRNLLASSSRSTAADAQQRILDYESAYHDSSRFGRDSSYWADVFDTMPTTTTLARRTASPSLDPIMVAGELPVGLRHLLSASANRWALNSTAILVAAFALYFSRASGQRVVCMSLPVAARITGALRTSAGSVSNIVPIVVEVGDEMPVSGFVEKVATTLMGALRHQTYRGEQMLRDRGATAGHLAHVGPVMNIFPARLVVDLGVDLTAHYHVVTTGPVADLNVNIYPSGETGSLAIDLEANPGRYDISTVTQHRDNLIAVLASLCRAPDRVTIGEIDVPVVEPRDGPRPGPPAVLSDLLTRHRDSPDVAVVEGSLVLTHQELARAVDALRDTLRTSGIGAEDRVVAILPRSLAEVIAFHAVAAVGACYVPIDPHHPSQRQQSIIETCRPTMILTTQSHPAHLSSDVDHLALGPRGEHFSETPTLPRRASRPTVHQAAYIIFTSGSTGTPKAVVTTATGLGPLVEHIGHAYSLTTESVVAHAASTAFDTSIVEIIAAAVTGAALAIVPDGVVGGRELAQHLSADGVTHLLTTPGVLATLRPTDITTLTHLIVGGDVCPPELMDEFADHTVVRCAYGPTEATCSVTMTDILDRQSLAGMAVPLGHPMVGVRAHVRDKQLRLVPPGVEGELYISGPALARGYLNDPALSAARFVADPTSADGGRMYRTGDRAAWRTDGSLDFLGRTDNQVKIRGVRIEPFEINTALRTVPGVTNAVTVPRHHHRSVVLASYVTTSTPLSANVIRQTLTRVLPAHMLPSAVTVLDRLPLTPAGKIDHEALPAPAFLASAPYRGAVSDDEQSVVRAFEAATGTTTIGADDDFFEIGGDSLSATVVVANLNAEKKLALSVRDVFECRTPASLSSRMVSAPRVAPLVHRTDETATFALAPAQRNVGLDDQSPAHLIPFTLEFTDTLNRRALDQAIDEVAQSHPLMRTRFIGGTMIADSVPANTVSTIGDADRSLTEFLHRPFDLAAEHPIRFGVRNGASSTTVAVVAHHVAIDGWSLSIIARDLIAAYFSAVINPSHPSITAPAPAHTGSTSVDFFDYAVWANAQLGDDGDPVSLAHRQRQFWRSELADLPMSATLPSDRPRPHIWRPHASRQRITLRQHWSDITSLAHVYSVSTTTVLRASLASVLLAASDDPAIAVATPLSGRVNSQLHNIVGMFVNTVPVVCRRDDVHAAHGLTAVADAEHRAFAHADIPYAEITEVRSVAATSSAHPLFQVVLSIENNSPTAPIIDEAHRAGVMITPRPSDIAKCDLHCAVNTGADGFIEALYPTSMFDAATVDELLESWLAKINLWHQASTAGTASTGTRH